MALNELDSEDNQKYCNSASPNESAAMDILEILGKI
jgi:hypothetical protein